MGNLRVKGARRAEDQHRLVAGLLLEQSSDLFRRFGEIGGDGDMGHVRIAPGAAIDVRSAQSAAAIAVSFKEDLPLYGEPGEGSFGYRISREDSPRDVSCSTYRAFGRSANPDEGDRMRIRARDKLHGTITDVTKGATTVHVHIDFGHGVMVRASKPTVRSCIGG